MLKQVWKTALDEVRNSDVEGVGNLRWEDGDKLYRWVRNNDGANDLSLGDVAFHDSTDSPATMFDDVQQCNSADLGLMAGVVMAPTLVFYLSTDKSKKCYGWVQVIGYSPSAQVLHHTGTSYAVGDYCLGVDGQDYVIGIETPTSQKIYSRNVQLLEAMASGVNTTSYKMVYVNCL